MKTQVRRDSNPQQTVLETAALPLELLTCIETLLNLPFAMKGMLTELGAVFHQLQLFRIIPAVLLRGVVSQTRLGTNQGDQFHATLAFLCHIFSPENQKQRAFLRI